MYVYNWHTLLGLFLFLPEQKLYTGGFFIMSIDIKQIENTIGYTFKNKDLLQQAFVRRSYSEEKGGQNNEVLEFIGDKALDFAVIRLMMLRFGKITEDKEWSEFKLTNPKYFKTKLGEGKFTDIKTMLVQKKALSNCMDKLGFHKQLIMGKGDVEQGIENEDSVKEDLFEAIIGAVAVDSDYDMNEITYVVDAMLDLDAFFNNERFDEDSDHNYVSWLQEWTQGEGYGLPNYEYQEDYNHNFICWVTIQGDDGFYLRKSGEERSHAKARAAVAYRAYTYLQEHGYIKNEFEEAVGEPIYEESTRQVNELFQKKLIDKPNYELEQSYNDNGESEWYCTLIVRGYDKKFYGYGFNKKESQRNAAYAFLCYIMGIESDDYE